jgi:hypothetical protein
MTRNLCLVYISFSHNYSSFKPSVWNAAVEIPWIFTLFKISYVSSSCNLDFLHTDMFSISIRNLNLILFLYSDTPNALLLLVLRMLQPTEFPEALAGCWPGFKTHFHASAFILLLQFWTVWPILLQGIGPYFLFSGLEVTYALYLGLQDLDSELPLYFVSPKNDLI